MNGHPGYREAQSIDGRRAEIEGRSGIDGLTSVRIQTNGLDPLITAATGAVAQAARERAEADCQKNNKDAGTATMHEPSSRPLSGRERSVRWKTVSVKGHDDLGQGRKSRFQGTKMLAAGSAMSEIVFETLKL